MPKPYTFPTLLDEVTTISIKSLKTWGYFTPGSIRFGEITWTIAGTRTGSVNITVDLRTLNPYLELDYVVRGTQKSYRVSLEQVPSNLGVGHIWYFRCPITGKRCRKLYLVDSYFAHREAVPGLMYYCQTLTKNFRVMWTILSREKPPPKKTHYRGKPTRSYERWLRSLKIRFEE